MKRCIALRLPSLTACFLAGLAGCAHGGARPWPQVAPPGAGATARMPGRPVVRQEQRRDGDGTPMTFTAALSTTGRGLFSLTVVEYEGGAVGDPAQLVDLVAAHMVEDLELDDAQHRTVDAPGFFAWQDLGRRPDGIVVGLRQYVGARRVYIALAAAPPQNAGQITQFLDSVALDPSDRIYPVADESGRGDVAPFYNPRDDFAVRMPALSAMKRQPLRLGDGDSADARTFEGRSRDGARYRVRVINLPERSDGESLEEVAAALSLGPVEAAVHASGYAGQERQAPEGHPGRYRIYRTAGRVYVLESDAAGDALSAFFDSFRIL